MRCRLLCFQSSAQRHFRDIYRTWTLKWTEPCRSFSSSLSNAIVEEETKQTVVDVLIVGGGVVGCSLARQLQKRVPHLSVGLVEAKSPPATTENDDIVDNDNQNRSPPHPRSYALSPASLEWLELDPNDNKNNNSKHRLGFYDSMQVWESGNPASVLFSSKDIASSTSSNSQYLGAVVEDSVIVQHLWKKLTTNSSSSSSSNPCHVFANSTISSLILPQHHHELAQVQLLQSTNSNNTTKKINTTIKAQLVIGADGANSAVRRMANISRRVLDYHQHALTFTVQLQSRHRHGGRAFQRFLPTGPLALLPTFLDDHAIVVWSTTPETAQEWINKVQDDDHVNHGRQELADHVNYLLQQGPEMTPPLFETLSCSSSMSIPTPFSNLLYGAEKLVQLAQYGPALWAQESKESLTFVAPPQIQSIASSSPLSSPSVFAFPLLCAQVTSYTAPRLALCGDAAHSVHPMAGLGLNLGLQDAANLVQVVEKAAQAGMDLSLLLRDEYETPRQFQVSATLAGIHALQRIFGQEHVLTKHVKSLGMNMVQHIPLLRQQLAQAACHGVSLPSFIL